jgi:hypothetical protein
MEIIQDLFVFVGISEDGSESLMNVSINMPAKDGRVIIRPLIFTDTKEILQHAKSADQLVINGTFKHYELRHYFLDDREGKIIIRTLEHINQTNQSK